MTDGYLAVRLKKLQERHDLPPDLVEDIMARARLALKMIEIGDESLKKARLEKFEQKPELPLLPLGAQWPILMSKRYHYHLPKIFGYFRQHWAPVLAVAHAAQFNIGHFRAYYPAEYKKISAYGSVLKLPFADLNANPAPYIAAVLDACRDDRVPARPVAPNKSGSGKRRRNFPASIPG